MTSFARPGRLSPWQVHLGSVVIVVVAALLQIGPALLHPSERVAGERSDPASEVWRFEEMASGRLGLVEPTTTPMVNAPEGFQLRRPVEVTTAFIDVLAWPLERVAEAATVRNAMLVLGVVANGLAMLVVAAALRMPRWAGVVGAVVFMYAPPLVVEARLHVALVYVFTIPLAFAAGVRLQRRCDLLSGALLGLTVGASCYVNPYLPLYTGATAAAVVIAALVHRRRRVLAPALVAVATTAVTAAPALVLLTVRRSDTLASVRRTIAEIDAYVTTPVQMVRALGPWPLGAAVLALACVLLLRSAEPVVRTSAVLVAVAGVLLAAATQVDVGGVRLPLPNRVLFALYPAWRVVGRASVLVWFVVALALVIGAGAVPRVVADRRDRLIRTAVVAVVAASALVVLAASWRDGRPWFPVDETPELSAFLRERRGALAEYPLYGLEHHLIGPYLLRQTVHGRPLVNGNVADTVGQDLSQAAGRLDGPQAAAALALAGVRTVVVHGDDDPPPWGRDLGTFDGARVFGVDATADPAVVTWRGAYDEETSEGDYWRWLPDSTVVHVTSARPGSYRLRLGLLGVGEVRELQIGDTAVEVGPTERVVEVCVASREPGPAGLFVGSTDLVADTPATPLSAADNRMAVARVRDASVVGRCGD